MSRRAIAHLKRADPRMASLIERVGACKFAPRSEGTHFEIIARSILYQQLSGKAAATIHERFQGLFPQCIPTPEALATLDESLLRGVGLSRQKVAYLQDLARRTVEGSVSLDALPEQTDEEIISALTSVKGIGRWTAQMFLMFRLGRPDVLPDTDLGIQKGVQHAYRLRKLPSPERVKKIGAVWAPYRTFASWYLWRGLDVDDN